MRGMWMREAVAWVGGGCAAALLAAGAWLGAAAPCAGAELSPERRQTVESIRQLTDYGDGLNLYAMEVFYEYDLDRLTPVGVDGDQELLDLMLDEAAPGMGGKVEAPEFGCTAFTAETADGKVYLGRNYDFRDDASAMMCVCHPKGGYRSVCFSALSHLGFKDPFESEGNRMACLAAPLLPLDGMNEAGVGIAVLTLPSEPTKQRTGRPTLATPLLIRLVLDRAGSTEEAVELIRRYDCYATSGRDYHFYITDRSGDGRVVEWDCDAEGRPMKVTRIRTITNYFGMYEDRVESGRKNGKYGLGKERRDRVEAVLDAADPAADKATAWAAAKAASTAPDPQSIISNTQWSVLYGLSDRSHEFVLHRHWDDIFRFEDLGATLVGGAAAGACEK